MKSPLWRILSFCFIVTVRASADEPVTLRTPEELDHLFGPIALYPDALIALILPATTVSSDVVLASRYLSANGNPTNVENELWDDSVKALMHYPDVIKWMDQNLAWTKQAGEAFLAQPVEVMNSVQRLRAKARAAGTLKDTSQQQIIVEDDTIRIVPAQPEIIYVPVYDPEVVYVSRSGYYSDPFLTFGVGFATGFWLVNDCDWGHRRIWTMDHHDRERYWHDRADWRRPTYPGRPDYVDGAYRHQPWHPPANYQRPSSHSGNQSRPDDSAPNHSGYGNGSRNRPTVTDTRWSRPEPTPVDRDRPHSPDGRDGATHQRPGNSPTSTAPQVNPTPPTPVPVTTSVQPRGPESPAQNQRNHADRVSQPRVQISGPVNTPVPQTRMGPPQPAPSPRPAPVSVPARIQPPATARTPDQSNKSEKTSSNARIDKNYQVDRSQRE